MESVSYQDGVTNATIPARLPSPGPSVRSSREESVAPPGGALRELVHRVQEALVGPRQLELVQEKLHRLDWIQLRERLPEQPYLLQLVLLEEQLLLAGARLLDVDRRENPLVHQATVQMHFHVARPLELLEDHVVHA